MSEIDYSRISKREPDWLDLQCNKVDVALKDLDLEQRFIVIEQFLDYLRMEKAYTKDEGEARV